MFARFECLLGHGKVLRVRRADVDCTDGGIAQDCPVVRRHGDGEARSQTLRQVDVRVYNGSGLDRFQPSHRVEVHAAYEACAEDCRLDWFHRVLDSPR